MLIKNNRIFYALTYESTELFLTLQERSDSMDDEHISTTELRVSSDTNSE